jgi:hypothetical protein
MTLRQRVGELMHARRSGPQRPDLRRIEERLDHMEALVQGLQDSVHRNTVRQEERISELERKTEPEALAQALSDDARRRGL